MEESTPRGIQATLLDYFQDTEYFTVKEAEELVLDHQQRDVNAESIRARIYEGIDKGLFERVGKGLYMVTRQDEQGEGEYLPAHQRRRPGPVDVPGQFGGCVNHSYI